MLVFMGVFSLFLRADIQDTLARMDLNTTQMQAVEGILKDFHAERKVYYKNRSRMRQLMIFELSKEMPDFQKFKVIFNEIENKYMDARVRFYEQLTVILTQKQKEEFILKYAE